MLEQVAQDHATRGFIDIDPDELRPLVGRTHRAFGQLAANVVRLLVVAVVERLPDLLLARVVVGHRERHQLLQRHAIFGVDVEQFLGDRSKLQPLLDDTRADEEPRGDVLLAQALLAQDLECAKLVERMKIRALDILRKRIFLGQALGPHHARYGLGLVHALLLDQEFEGPVAAATRRHLEHAGLLAVGVHHRPDIEALEKRAPGNVFGKLLDGDAGLDPAHVGLAEHQLVEGDVARGAERNLGGCHVDILRDGRPKAFLSTSNPSPTTRPPLTLSAPPSATAPRLLSASLRRNESKMADSAAPFGAQPAHAAGAAVAYGRSTAVAASKASSVPGRNASR